MRNRYVAFLRAVNVGGRVVKMDTLRRLLEAAGLSNVSTLIASGNVLFESGRSPEPLETLIEKTLRAGLGYEVVTMVRSAGEVASVVSHVEKTIRRDGAILYVGFLKKAPSVEASKAIEALSNEVDVLTVQGRELYWQSRKSFSQSTVNPAKLEKMLGVAATVRNFTTVKKLHDRSR